MDSAEASSTSFSRKSSFDSEQDDDKEDSPFTFDPAGNNFKDDDGNEYLQDQSPEDDASLLVSPAEYSDGLKLLAPQPQALTDDKGNRGIAFWPISLVHGGKKLICSIRHSSCPVCRGLLRAYQRPSTKTSARDLILHSAA